MLALKSLDIDLTKSETKTLLGFGSLYALLVLIIIGSFSFLYFNFQKDLMLQEKRQILQSYSNDLIFQLKDLHINFDRERKYPRHTKFKSAIYDSEYKKIFSLLDSDDIRLNNTIYLDGDNIFFIREPESYYLGAKYIVLEIKDNQKWLSSVKKKMFFFSLVAFILMALIGYSLLRILLRPMKEALNLLDRFIKDTTHELNTPISTIMTNIEMIDKDKLDNRLYKKINRIEIGAKTISNIYEDLTFLTLDNKIISQNKKIDLYKLINQRVEFFKSLSNIKKVAFHLDMKKDVYLFADEKKISKLIDNLLSNAIKYNKIAGNISVKLDENSFIVEDTGKGMSKENLALLFKRYTRFDKSVGGFGIGLNIVSIIAKEYELDISYSSKIGVGTKVEVKWEK